MDVFEAIRSRRSIRFFKQEPIPEDTMIKLIAAARCAPSAANRQPLEFIIVTNKELNNNVFKQLGWAAYVHPKRNPPADKRPVAYIIVIINKHRALTKLGPVDAAAAIENILLSAHALGLGSCWVGSVNREKLGSLIDLPNDYQIDSVIALGYPDEKPVMEDCKTDSIEYYLDENGRLHVPKRPLRSIIHIDKYRKNSA